MSESAFGLPLHNRPSAQMSQVRSLPKLKGDTVSQHARTENFGGPLNEHYNNDIGERINEINRNVVPQTCGTEMRIDLNAVLGPRRTTNIGSRNKGKYSIT